MKLFQKVVAVIILIAAILFLTLEQPEKEDVYFKVEQQKPIEKVVETIEESLLVSEVLANPIKYPVESKRLEKIQKFQSLKQASISFYGKVVDQEGNPVVGAVVTGYRAYYPIIPNLDLSRSAEDVRLVTDPNGVFSMIDEKVASLTVQKITKSGYEIQANRTYKLSRGGYKMIEKITNPDKPVIFHAWKKSQAEEQLFIDERRINFDPSGRIYAIDLFHFGKGVKSNVRDVRMSCKRPLELENGSKFDWVFTIEAIDGGIIESEDSFMYIAPKAGYLSKWKFSMKKDDHNWVSNITRNFYLKSRNDQVFGRMMLTIKPHYNNNCRVNAEWSLNPNASRNLE